MKLIRVLTAATVLLSITLTLSGCIVIPITKRYNIEHDTVDSIDIYDLRSCENRDHGTWETLSPFCTLSDNQLESFLNDLSGIRFEDTIIIALAAVDPSFSYGEWVVQIHYTDGTYELISSGGFGGTYSSDHERIATHHFGCDADEWAQFILKYVPEATVQTNPQS